jgi:hypothetical protein
MDHEGRASVRSGDRICGGDGVCTLVAEEGVSDDREIDAALVKLRLRLAKAERELAARTSEFEAIRDEAYKPVSAASFELDAIRAELKKLGVCGICGKSFDDEHDHGPGMAFNGPTFVNGDYLVI